MSLISGEAMIGVFIDRLQKARLQQILAAEQMDEFGMAAKMIIGKIEQLHHAVDRSDVSDVQLQLLGAQLAENLLEDRDVKMILAAEIVVDHPRIGPR